MTVITAYTDGACKGNNPKVKTSPGGWGYFFDFDDGTYTIRIMASGGEAQTTNQKMELQAVVELLKKIPSGYETHIYSDSHYVLKGLVSQGKWGTPLDKITKFDGWINGWIKKNFKDVANVDKWKKIYELSTEHLNRGTIFYFYYVKGHSGDYGNDLADYLSNEGVKPYL